MPAVNIVSSLFSLPDCSLGKATLNSGKLESRSSFSGGALMALNHRPVFADKKVIICVVYMFYSVCCLFHAKSCRLSDREKSSVLLTI